MDTVESGEESPDVVPSLAPQSLSDVEFFVLRHPLRLSMDHAARLKEHLELFMERSYRRQVPVVILNEGMSLEAVRSGGWIYAFEREPEAPAEYEVALLYPGGRAMVWFAERLASGAWYLYPSGRMPEGAEIYAWRPAPLPPPVRRSEAVPIANPSPIATPREAGT